jgi:hypothetical protein
MRRKPSPSDCPTLRSSRLETHRTFLELGKSQFNIGVNRSVTGKSNREFGSLSILPASKGYDAAVPFFILVWTLDEMHCLTR